MSIASEIQRLQKAKENITIALLRAGYYIPSGITLDEYPPYIDPYFFEELTFKIISGGTITWKASNTGITKTIEYKLNDGEWTSITSNTGASSPIISVSAGDVVQFRGDNDGYATSSSIYTKFYSGTVMFEVEGNIMSLIDSTGFTTATTLTNNYNFYYLFYNCTGLTSAENLILPATTLAQYCYSAMFQGCTSLTTAPSILPATTLAERCYGNMFQSCKSLTIAPELPATTLASYCCYCMFDGCTSLTTAPSILPATTLAERCYQYMFSSCSGLTTAPSILPATTLANYCYYGMFQDCSSLEIAPILPATTLVSECYRLMFTNCHNLNYIKAMFTTTPSTSYTSSWVSGVASTGTFVKNSAATWDVTGNNGIPSGWTVQTASS